MSDFRGRFPAVGRIAILQDPLGASFAIYTPAQSPEAEAQFKDFSWHELATSDHEAALAFYEKLLLEAERGRRHGTARHLPDVRPRQPDVWACTTS